MKSLLVKYASVIRFVVLFLGTYLVLSVLYSIYLSVSKGGAYPPDFITNAVAKQTGMVINGFGYNSNVEPHSLEPSMKLHVNGMYLAKVIEGCNAVSIIILFASFIVAFAQGFKKTLLFVLGGAVFIYVVNVLRIALLAIAIYHYPERVDLLHGVVFPGVIYSMVFMLWMIWVRSLKPIKDE